MRALGRLLRLLQRLGRAWWEADRVRVPPSEGQLLRLRPPSLLRIGGRLARVARRSVAGGASPPHVVYLLRLETGPAELRVAPGPRGGGLTVQLRTPRGEEVLSEAEVEVLSRPPAPRLGRL